MPKWKLRALAIDFLQHSEKYKFSITIFLEDNKIIGDERILREILEEITKIYHEQYRDYLRKGVN